MSKQAEIRLSDHFTYGRLLRFTWPSMIMMVVTSIYGVVDGLMVSNFTGTTPFAALNLIWPFVAIIGAVGFMFGTGGSALVAKTLGRGQTQKACDLFSMLTFTALGVSAVLGMTGCLFVRKVAIALGAEGEMIDYCVTYGGILLVMLPAYVMQIYFQQLMITAERPKMAMAVTIGAGITNVIFDILFIAMLKWGLAGAAWATVMSQLVGSIVPLAYFIAKRKSDMLLRLGRFHIDLKALGQACSNGVSEFVMSISLSIVSMLYMYQLIEKAGENGVAAYGILMYFAFVFSALFIGYGIGVAPVVSYHFGANNDKELHSLLCKSLTLIAICGIIIVSIAQIFAHPLAGIFVSYDADLHALTTHAFRIYSLMFLVAGFNGFASAFFTALNNGPVSALISMMRTIIFEAGSVLLLPLIFGIEGIWWSVSVGETVTMFFSFYLLYHFRKEYGY